MSGQKQILEESAARSERAKKELAAIEPDIAEARKTKTLLMSQRGSVREKYILRLRSARELYEAGREIEGNTRETAKAGAALSKEQAFFQLGPQFGFMLGDKSKQNFEYSKRNTADRVGIMYDAVQDTLSIDRKFDYGIAVGAGVEFSHPKMGHFMLEGRYYYGLGNIFNSTKRDYFGRSNNNSIMIKLTYLFDVIRTKNDKIK